MTIGQKSIFYFEKTGLGQHRQQFDQEGKMEQTRLHKSGNIGRQGRKSIIGAAV
jgi:hypothetical protein